MSGYIMQRRSTSPPPPPRKGGFTNVCQQSHVSGLRLHHSVLKFQTAIQPKHTPQTNKVTLITITYLVCPNQGFQSRLKIVSLSSIPVIV